MPYTSETMYAFGNENHLPYTLNDYAVFDKLSEMLTSFNEKINVTAIKSETGICACHFIDSIYPLVFDLIPKNASVIDVGCGGGFPGLPLSLLRKDIHLTSLDSTAKKLSFVKEATNTFSLNATTAPYRAEDFVKEHREMYDVCVSRAVSSLPVLCELCLPFVKVGGVFIAYKSEKECDKTNKDSELTLAQNAVKTLGGRVEHIFPCPISDRGEILRHALIVIKKVSGTPKLYPRAYATIMKKPL